MKNLLSDGERDELLANGRLGHVLADHDPIPVLALRAPDGPQIWLLTELAEDGDTAYGLCDHGVGAPECGELSLDWLAAFRGPLGLPIERMPREEAWQALTIGALARIAVAAGKILF